jgi:hypothetical protein
MDRIMARLRVFQEDVDTPPSGDMDYVEHQQQRSTNFLSSMTSRSATRSNETYELSPPLFVDVISHKALIPAALVAVTHARHHAEQAHKRPIVALCV